MQIFTVDDESFSDLLELWKESTQIGKYWKNNKVHVVACCSQFVLVGNQEDPNKLAIKPARNLSQSKQMALKLLENENQRGTKVEIATSD